MYNSVVSCLKKRSSFLKLQRYNSCLPCTDILLFSSFDGSRPFDKCRTETYSSYYWCHSLRVSHRLCFHFLNFFSLREVFSRNIQRQRHKLLYCLCPFEPLVRFFVASVLSFAYGLFLVKF